MSVALYDDAYGQQSATATWARQEECGGCELGLLNSNALLSFPQSKGACRNFFGGGGICCGALFSSTVRPPNTGERGRTNWSFLCVRFLFVLLSYTATTPHEVLQYNFSSSGRRATEKLSRPSFLVGGLMSSIFLLMHYVRVIAACSANMFV